MTIVNKESTGEDRLNPMTHLKIWDLARWAFSGLLVGTANLIPGVSGGTMILAMGLYQEFIDAVADMTALRFSRRRIVFLGVVGLCAVVAIKGLAGVILVLLFRYDAAMYALFIGLTLGGAPALWKLIRPLSIGPALAMALGVSLMAAMSLFQRTTALPQHFTMDFVSGILAAITMVLPGVSGSYVLLIMGQYDRIVGSVRDLDFSIIVPVGIGAAIGVVGLSNLLKLLILRFQRPTIGFLLGLMLGSVLGLWPFGREPSLGSLSNFSIEDIRNVAQQKGVTLDAEPNRDLLIEQFESRWAARDRTGDYAARVVASAAFLSILGFWVTFALSRFERGTGIE